MRSQSLLIWFIAGFSFLSGCTKKDPFGIDPNPGSQSSDRWVVGSPKIQGLSSATLQVDEVLSAYIFIVPPGTDITKLRLQIEVSKGAKIAPDPSLPRDYTKAQEFTVTAESGDEQKYTFAVYHQNVYGKNCQLRRVESGSDYYLEFSYDSRGRVSKVDMHKSGKHFRLTCNYEGNGDLKDAFISQGEGGALLEYRPVLENGKLVRVAFRSPEGAIYTSVDANNQILSKDHNKTICYSYYYVNERVYKSISCTNGNVYTYQYFDQPNDARYFLAAQLSYPAFMLVFYDFISTLDGPDILKHHYGQYVPWRRNEYYNAGPNLKKRITMDHVVNAEGFPREMKIKSEDRLNTDFPLTGNSTYQFYYNNCQ